LKIDIVQELFGLFPCMYRSFFQESERVIRQLLHLDVSSGPNPNLNSPHSTFNAPGKVYSK
jgi:hypothetical protein